MKEKTLTDSESPAHLTLKDYKDYENLAHEESCSKIWRSVEKQVHMITKS